MVSLPCALANIWAYFDRQIYIERSIQDIASVSCTPDLNGNGIIRLENDDDDDDDHNGDPNGIMIRI